MELPQMLFVMSPHTRIGGTTGLLSPVEHRILRRYDLVEIAAHHQDFVVVGFRQVGQQRRDDLDSSPAGTSKPRGVATARQRFHRFEFEITKRIAVVGATY